jgi:hypothetical protein
MGETCRYSDPYGAPEIVVDGVAYREMFSPDVLRAAFFAKEQGELIIKVKILMPVVSLMLAHQSVHDFIEAQGVRLRRAG